MLTVTPLGARALVLTLGGDGLATSFGANCLAVRGRQATLLVDPLVAPAHARLVDAELQARGFPPVTHVVLTHHHTDHALGAGWFAGRGAVVACHVRCAEAMCAQHPAIVAERRSQPGTATLFADAEPHRPAVTFEDRWRVDLGDLEVEAQSVGPAHTPGDVVVSVPSEGLLAAGDLVLAGFHFNYEEATPERLAGSLARLADLGPATVVPGHGPPGGPALVDEQLRYHEAVARLASTAPSRAAARAALLERFPRHAYLAGVDSALDRLRAPADASTR